MWHIHLFTLLGLLGSRFENRILYFFSICSLKLLQPVIWFRWMESRIRFSFSSGSTMRWTRLVIKRLANILQPNFFLERIRFSQYYSESSSEANTTWRLCPLCMMWRGVFGRITLAWRGITHFCRKITFESKKMNLSPYCFSYCFCFPYCFS